MIKLKGEQNSAAQQTMEKVMGLKPKGSDGPTPVAKALGLPSAVKHDREAKDWSSQSNRINLGVPATIRAKTEAKPLEGDREYYLDNPSYESAPSAPKDGDDSEDDELFGDDGLEALRMKRMMELRKQAQARSKWTTLGHGVYSEIAQDEFLPTVTQSKYCVCHFYHSNFERCRIVDKHLNLLCQLV